MTTDPKTATATSTSTATQTSATNTDAKTQTTATESSFLKSAGGWMKSSFNKAKEATSQQMDKLDQRLTMEGLLKQALISLKMFLDPKFLKSEEKLIRSILKKAQGIVFLTEVKGGFLFGVKGGSGIILARTDKNAHINIKSAQKVQQQDVVMEWSGACAVGSGGISFGFQGGATKIDHIIILPTEDHIDLFLGKGQLQLGGSASAIVANYGRNADVGMSAGGGGAGKGNVAPIMSYSFGVKGLFGGVSLDGEVLKPRNKCNQQFYENAEIGVKDILKATPEKVTKNEDYQTIVEMLNQYVNFVPNYAPGQPKPKPDENTNNENANVNASADVNNTTKPEKL